RLSLITLEYSFEWDEAKGKNVNNKLLTPAKRASFLVGQGESTHTACKQLNEVLVKAQKESITIDDLKQAFSVEKVSKEFFEKYKQLFLKLHDELERLYTKNATIKADFDKHNIHLADFAKKTLGQLVFLQFLQKKGWLGVKQGQAWGEGDKNFLQNLFNKKYKDYTNFFNDIVEPLFYEALATKDNRDFNDLYIPLNCRIPFLNGGLFEPLNGYKWRDTDITIDNAIFEAVFDTFNLYNFTVKEDEPLEKEVAVDPEMLGKVFEELLEVKDRKSKGAFYTPREIVHYMCQESLIQYLYTQLSEPSFLEKKQPEALPTLEEIRTFIELAGGHMKKKGEKTDALPQSIQAYALALDTALATITVCDPAIGSGAFPVGMLHELVRARTALTPYLTSDSTRSPYQLKRHAIENCIYGVDIDPGAIEIAKLRFWLALVVDQTLEADQHINPLPNMDYKLMCGNSLLGCDLKRDVFTYQTLDALDEAKHAFFNETDVDNKKALKEDINKLKQQLTGQVQCFDYHIDFYEVMHGKGGFDVVIGNPPYGLINKKQNQKNAIVLSKEEEDFFKKSEEYKSVSSGMLNIYKLFIVRSLNVLKRSGVFSEIFPLAFVGDVSNKNLRSMILNQYRILCIEAFPERDDLNKRVFKSAKVSACILNLQKLEPLSEYNFTLRINEDAFIDYHQKPVSLTKKDIGMFDSTYWTFPVLESKEYYLLKKCFNKSLKLSNFAHCYTGEIDLSLNKNFITDNDKHSEMIKGAIIDRYIKRQKMSQGEIQYLDSQAFLQGNTSKKARHHLESRIVMQGITGVNEKTRLKMTLLDRGIFCANSVNYLIFTPPVKYNKLFVLGILNSQVLNFIFKKFSTNSNVNGYEVDNLPIPKASEAEQAPLIAKVEAILAHTQSEGYTSNPTAQATVAQLEADIDVLVYHLYQLTYQEVLVIDPAFPLSQEAYEAIGKS
ncbi:MAG: Eco57I restriction-modification methylase domain-containing protein, partial [Vampirovibrionales bacterium]